MTKNELEDAFQRWFKQYMNFPEPYTKDDLWYVFLSAYKISHRELGVPCDYQN